MLLDSDAPLIADRYLLVGLIGALGVADLGEEIILLVQYKVPNALQVRKLGI
jgi:hypothetical protein